MPLTFNQFLSQNSSLAKGFLGRRGSSNLVEQLCRATFEETALKDRGAARVVHQTMLTIYHEHFIDDLVSPTGRAMRILNKKLDIDTERTWIPFEEFLDLLTPILLGISLIRRMNAALHIFEWGEEIAPNAPIVNFFNDAFAACKPRAPYPLPLADVGQILAAFQDALCAQTVTSCTYHKYLEQLVRHPDDITLVAQGVDDLRILVERPPEIRFGRDQDVTDRYGWLRERWNEAKSVILRRLDCEELTAPTCGQDPEANHGE